MIRRSSGLGPAEGAEIVADIDHRSFAEIMVPLYLAVLRDPDSAASWNESGPKNVIKQTIVDARRRLTPDRATAPSPEEDCP